MKRIILTALLLATVSGLSACTTTQPIHDVEKQAVTSSASQDEVRQAIVDAATSLGWVITDDYDNEITAVLDIRTHQATVSIPYSSHDYSILYKNSINLNHSGDKIHRNYNNWVANLDREIRRNLNIARTDL